MSLSTLFQPILEGEWYTVAITVAPQYGLVTTNWTDFSPEKNILRLTARMLEALHVACVEMWRGMWLAYARGDSLSQCAEQLYFTPRLAATFATCLVDFTNVSDPPTAYTVAAGDYITLTKSSDGEAQYRVDGPLSIPPAGLTGQLATAIVAGTVCNAVPGEVDSVVGNSFPGLLVENTTVAEARDVESDTSLVERAQLATNALAIGGPDGAYEYFARGGDVNGEIDSTIAAIGVDKVRVSSSLTSNHVTVYLATPTGGVSGPNVALIEAKLQRRVLPSGVRLTVLSATELPIDIVYEAFLPDTSTVGEDELKAAILARLTEYFPSTPIGGPAEKVATPGKTGAITADKVRGLITDVDINGDEPVDNATVTVNGAAQQLMEIDDRAVLGTVTATITYQPAQEP